MATRFSIVQTTLNNKLASSTFNSNATETSQLNDLMRSAKNLLNTRHSLFLSQIASSMFGYLCACTLRPSIAPLGAASGYLIARFSTLFENIDEWYFLTPEDLPLYNSGFCAALVDDINHSSSAAELIPKLNHTVLAIKKEIDAFNNTTASVASPIGAALGYWIGGTQMAKHLFAYNWPGKAVFTQATCTGIFSGLGIGCGYAAEGVEIRQEEIGGLRR